MVEEARLTARSRGFLSLAAHPAGCAARVGRSIEAFERAARPRAEVSALVIGASTGYGLSSLLNAVFGYAMPSVGVCLERPAERGRTASAGWYNLASATRAARERGLSLRVVNEDCFAEETKAEVVRLLSEAGQPVGLVVYSVAAPVRVDPETHERLRSVLKPIGEVFRTKSLRIDEREVTEVEIEPATPDEVEATRRVMGGEDWELWLRELSAAGLLADGVKTVAYTYIGPEATAPIYREGTIGVAKADLEATALRLHAAIPELAGGGAWASVNGAAVTQASTAIPAVPLYLSLLLAAADGKVGTFRSVDEQIGELFEMLLGPTTDLNLDAEGRIRLDGWELDPPLQSEIMRRLDLVQTENLDEVADLAGFERAFRQLSGFDVTGVDYDAAVEIEIPIEDAVAGM